MLHHRVLARQLFRGFPGQWGFKTHCRWSYSTSHALKGPIQFIKTKRLLEQTNKQAKKQTPRHVVAIGTEFSNASSALVLTSTIRSENNVPSFFWSKMSGITATKIKILNHVNIMKLMSSSDDKRKKHLQAMVTNVTLTQQSSNLINHTKLENYCNLLRTLRLHLERKIS